MPATVRIKECLGVEPNRPAKCPMKGESIELPGDHPMDNVTCEGCGAVITADREGVINA